MAESKWAMQGNALRWIGQKGEKMPIQEFFRVMADHAEGTAPLPEIPFWADPILRVMADHAEGTAPLPEIYGPHKGCASWTYCKTCSEEYTRGRLKRNAARNERKRRNRKAGRK